MTSIYTVISCRDEEVGISIDKMGLQIDSAARIRVIFSDGQLTDLHDKVGRYLEGKRASCGCRQ